MTNIKENETVRLGKNLKSMVKLSKHYDPEWFWKTEYHNIMPEQEKKPLLLTSMSCKSDENSIFSGSKLM